MASYICGAGQLRVKAADGKIRVVKRGEPVPEASGWPLNILDSHLRIGHLLREEDAHRLSAKPPNYAPKPVHASVQVTQKAAPLSAASPASASPAPAASSGSGRPTGSGGSEAQPNNKEYQGKHGSRR